MEALVILLFIILIVLILSFRSSALQKIQRLEEEIARLRKEMSPGVRASSISKEMEPVPPPAVVPPETAQPHVFPERRSVAAIHAEPAAAGHAASAAAAPAEAAAVPRRPSPQPAISRPGFFERHPDLEKFIGENLISKIGIAILVLAIGFFVKYAIDNDWIGPVGRVGVGLLCGACSGACKGCRGPRECRWWRWRSFRSITLEHHPAGALVVNLFKCKTGEGHGAKRCKRSFIISLSRYGGRSWKTG